jgi:stress response protein SCP2
VKLNKHVNNIILGLGSLQNFNSVQQVSSRIENGHTDNTLLSCSFNEDIKKIEE